MDELSIQYPLSEYIMPGSAAGKVEAKPELLPV